jgi:hypothetical protein
VLSRVEQYLSCGCTGMHRCWAGMRDALCFAQAAPKKLTQCCAACVCCRVQPLPQDALQLLVQLELHTTHNHLGWNALHYACAGHRVGELVACVQRCTHVCTLLMSACCLQDCSPCNYQRQPGTVQHICRLGYITSAGAASGNAV